MGEEGARSPATFNIEHCMTMLDIEMSDRTKVSEEQEQHRKLCSEAVTDTRRRVGFIPKHPYIRHPHSYTEARRATREFPGHGPGRRQTP